MSTAASSRSVVGRAPEFALLDEVWRRCVAGGHQLALISGEAGLGKTTLVTTFTQAHQDEALVLTTHCIGGVGEPIPYAPFVQAVKALAAALGTDQLVAWVGGGRVGLGALLPALRRETDVEPQRMQVFEAVASALEGAAAQRPVILVVEDCHWADPSSIELLRFLDAALARLPILIMVSYRSDEVTGRHPVRRLVAELQRRPTTTRVEVRALDAGEVAQLVRPLLGSRASTATVARIVERSEGIPYFAEELAMGDQRALPSTLSEALLARVHGLSEPAGQVVRLAAPAGGRVSHAQLQALSDLDESELDHAVREVVDAGVFVTNEGGYAFRHALLREVVEDDLLPGEHGRLHGRYADLLVARPELASPGQLARHLIEAGRDAEAFAASLSAAEQLTDDDPASLTHYEDALRLWDHVDNPEQVMGGGRAELLERAAQAAYWNSDNPRAFALMTQCLAETSPDADPRSVARRLLLKARTQKRGDTSEAVASAWAAHDLTPEDSIDRADVLDFLAGRALLFDTPTATLDLANQGLDIASRTGAESLVANLLVTKGCALCNLGAEQEGLALIEQGGAKYEPRMRLRYYTNLGHHLNYLGQYRRSAQLSAQGVEAARDLGLERWIGTMLAGNTAEALIALGDWQEASRLMERSLAINPPHIHYLQLRMLTGWLAWLRGDQATVSEVVSEMEPIFGQGAGEAQFQTAFLVPLAGEAIDAGNPDRAWSKLSAELARGIRQAPYPSWQLVCVARRSLTHLPGATPEQSQWLDACADAIPSSSVTSLFRAWYRAEASQSAADWRAVVTTNPDILPVWLAVDAHTRAAEATLSAGLTSQTSVEALADLEAAQALTGRLGTTRWDERLDALSHSLGQQRPTPPSSDAEGSMFTPREREVLALVAEGRTNGEIGKALFVSSKTASVHVSNILAKLGVATRGEAAAWAHRNGGSALPDG